MASSSVASPSRDGNNGPLRELERLRRKSGVADVLPREPPKKRRDIHMYEMPAHANRDSMLSSGSGFNNYRGLYNLAIIALFAFGSRLVLENIRKYGLLIRPSSTLEAMAAPRSLWGLFLLLSLNVYILTTVFIEKAAAASTIGPYAAKFLHWANIGACFLVGNALILAVHPPPAISFFVLFETVVVCMKLISYVAINQHYRLRVQSRTGSRAHSRNASTASEADAATTSAVMGERHASRRTARRRLASAGDTAGASANGAVQSSTQSQRRGQPNGVVSHRRAAAAGGAGARARWLRYPQNLTVKNMYYFMVVPTLCYELNFPRSERVRLRFLLRRSVEVVFLFVLIITLGQQWIMPTVENTFKDGANPSLSHLIERTLKLSVPNNIIWLAMFYFYFHSFLNVMGELFRFGDRQFYRDWWNATSVSYFWKNWNIPVHKWAVRHLYRPLTSAGYSRLQAQVAVFLFSAVMHEVLVSVPLGLFRAWSFLAMLGQIPLAYITDKFLVDTPYGNVVVWSTLFFGQPMAVMLYVQAYLLQQQQEAAL